MRNFLNYKFFVFLHTIYRISIAKLKAPKIGKNDTEMTIISMLYTEVF